ncbi:hypothetical protein ACFUMJ_01775 [Streptomyces olivaceus]|uniref:hypothetical protein n=1 Tax=Streptomyces TaxID=1883 RepID=UPI001FB7C618|nr:hypothetical protein [Streptomyces sp. CB09030]UOG79925.1 hypothetical protein L6J92_12275 [Streptomyces sp. CB09030]
MSLNKADALLAAQRFLEGRSRSFGQPVRIVESKVVVTEDALIAPYNSVAALEGDVTRKLGGNMPVHVDLTSGACRFLTLLEALEYE